MVFAFFIGCHYLFEPGVKFEVSGSTRSSSTIFSTVSLLRNAVSIDRLPLDCGPATDVLLIHAKSPSPFFPSQRSRQSSYFSSSLFSGGSFSGNFERALVHFAPRAPHHGSHHFPECAPPHPSHPSSWPRSETTLHFQPAISLSRSSPFSLACRLLTPVFAGPKRL